MKGRKFVLYLVPAVVFLTSLYLSMFSVTIPIAQTSSQITVYRVTGTADLSNPGTASYWNQIPWENISLTANIPNAPTSGLTHYILVKSAWNGTWIFVLVKWYAPEPAFGVWSAAAAGICPSASGPGLFRLDELMPGTKYFIESNYTNYISIVNGKVYHGRLVLNFSGVLLPTYNNSQITVLPNGTIIFWHSLRPMEMLLYNDGMFYGYYTNSTWYYPDRVAMMWYMGSGVPSMDGMHIGGKYPGQVFDGFNFTYAGGSLKQPGGAANIWMWVSGATWNNSTYDPAFKMNLWQNETDTGLSYVDPSNHGFAVPLYTNNTDMYEVDTAGIWYAPVSSNTKALNGSLFFIWTGAKYQDGYWIVEFARPLSVPQGYSNWMPNITVGNTYYVAFAVWQGKLGETLFDKSITPSFLQLTLVNSPPTSTTSSAAPSLLSSPSAIVTIVGTIIAVLAVIVIYVVFRK
ncbi:MAG: cytochrome b558/566 subunit A [Sulfolobaceae archaeon]